MLTGLSTQYYDRGRLSVLLTRLQPPVAWLHCGGLFEKSNPISSVEYNYFT